tara:strand:+ start:330 stop:575 length:246 start_codon:yes stop_codon:yes gene_type:complete
MWNIAILLVGIIEQINTKWCNSSSLNTYPYVVDKKKCVHKCKEKNICTHIVWDEQRSYCFLFDKCDTFIDDVVQLKTFKIK